MKLIIIAGSIYSIPSLGPLAENHTITSVVTIGMIHKTNLAIEQHTRLLNIPYYRFIKDQLLTDFKLLLLKEAPDLVLVFGMRYKIPKEIFNLPQYGFFNVHFSLLPQYRGSTPVFWQLKNGEEKGGITIHQLSDEFDEGPILAQKEFPIFQGESHSMYSGRLGLESAGFITTELKKIEAATATSLTRQSGAGSYFNKPQAADLKINWETQSARDIENLVNASNPDFGGAVTLFRGQITRILEVNPAKLNDPVVFTPGTIVLADMNYGIFVACRNMEFLRVNIVELSEGILSGFKLVSLGVKAGECFQTISELQQISIY